MDKRFFTFLLLAMAIVVGYGQFLKWKFPPPAKPPAAKQAAKPKPDDKAVVKPADKPEAPQGQARPAGPAAAGAAAPAGPPIAEKQVAPQWTTLGSLADDPRQRILVTFSNRGAAVERVELNNPRYHNVDNINPLGGYLGHFAEQPAPGGKGVVVNVVGPGTPAATAGLIVGDVITSLDDRPVTDVASFDAEMRATKPGAALKIGVLRGDKAQVIEARLRRHPLEVVGPSFSDPTKPTIADPASFLLTLQQIDDQVLELNGDQREIAGVDLRTAYWEILPADPKQPHVAAFRRVLPAPLNLEVIKRYWLSPATDPDAKHDTAAAYTLNLHVELKNVGDRPRKLAYRLDGPNGLPVEGYWYARDSKIGIESGCGMRDVVLGRFDGDYVRHGMYTCTQIVDGEATPVTDEAVRYVGVDAQYFSAVMMPQLNDPNEKRHPRVLPMLAGAPPDAAHKKLGNVTFRMTSPVADAEPGATVLGHDFKIYLGPKVPDVLAEYELAPLVSYGWFGWVAEPLLAIMHFFYGIVRNYGIAIILLTVVVRSAMFPLSRKQALNAVKMQELQPEIKKIAEKYKNNAEQKMRAQQELFRKHNYNPLSGCLPIFIQLPIFMGLYRSLAVDIELRQAPLISEGIRWASNLAAPDMAWYWKPYLPGFLGGEDGWLGPFLNLLPCVTIALFLIQQKMFMPPATDEQTAMQQKMIKYMMIFMCFMFFKVPGGLCVYFIASSIWSIAERQLLPKARPSPAAGATINVPAVAAAVEEKKRPKRR